MTLNSRYCKKKSNAIKGDRYSERGYATSGVLVRLVCVNLNKTTTAWSIELSIRYTKRIHWQWHPVSKQILHSIFLSVACDFGLQGASSGCVGSNNDITANSSSTWLNNVPQWLRPSDCAACSSFEVANDRLGSASVAVSLAAGLA